MKLSVSAYRAHSSAYKKILTNNYKSQLNYGSTAASISGGSHTAGLFDVSIKVLNKAEIKVANAHHLPHSHRYCAGSASQI